MCKEFKNKYTAIACINNKNVIGKNGDLLFKIKSDLNNFRMLTTGDVIIMGRSTFESLSCKPLKDRINIILTTKVDYEVDSEFDNVYICHSFEDVDELCDAYFSDKELFVIGGGSVYKQAFDLGIINKAIITLVNDDQDGDVYFHDIANDDRYKIIFKTMSIRDHIDDNYYRYIVYKKKD
jgi:dihydrofolate reductase